MPVSSLSNWGVPQAVLRIHDMLGWIRIRILGSMPLTNGSGSGFGSGSWIRIRIRILDPDPAIFVMDLQDASKKLIFLRQFFLLITF